MIKNNFLILEDDTYMNITNYQKYTTNPFLPAPVLPVTLRNLPSSTNATDQEALRARTKQKGTNSSKTEVNLQWKR